MFGLNQDTVNLISLIAFFHMALFLGIMIAAMLYRQVRRFGFSHSWDGDDFEKDVSL